MSKNLTTYLNQSYQLPGGQTLLANPIALCIAPTMPPNVVPVLIDWSKYNPSLSNPNIGVAVNLQAGLPSGSRLDDIRSIKIDNTFCAVPIFVQFPDTLDTISCPANAIVVANVATHQQQAIIYGTGFYNGRSPRTTVEFFNIKQEPLFIPGTLDDRVDVRYINGNNRTGAIAGNVVTYPNFNTVIPPSIGRLIAAVFGTEAAAAGAHIHNSATINGLAMTLAARTSSPMTGGNNGAVSIWYALVPTLTTLQAVLTCSSAPVVGGIGLFSIDNYSQVAPAQTDSAFGTGASNILELCQFDAIPGAGAVFGGIGISTTSIEPWQNADIFGVLNTTTGANFAMSSALAEYTENAAVVSGVKAAIIAGAMWI